uniref:Holin n=1 Tax=Klebsiella phage P287 TaxID=3229731 RepID=A0AB39C668_9CAUD
MKFTIAVMATLFSMHGVGALIFSIMVLVVVGIVDIYHHKTMTDLRLNRLINDINAACEGMEIKVVKK